MNVTRTMWLLGAAGIGAGLMYLLDPDRGTTRRATIKDQAVGMTNGATTALNSKARDLKNRASGLVAESKNLFNRNQTDQTPAIQ